MVFISDRNPEYAKQGLIHPMYTLPYSDLQDLSADALNAKLQRGEVVVFGHSFTDLIQRQLAAGFLLQSFYEDDQL